MGFKLYPLWFSMQCKSFLSFLVNKERLFIILYPLVLQSVVGSTSTRCINELALPRVHGRYLLELELKWLRIYSSVSLLCHVSDLCIGCPEACNKWSAVLRTDSHWCLRACMLYSFLLRPFCWSLAWPFTDTNISVSQCYCFALLLKDSQQSPWWYIWSW